LASELLVQEYAATYGFSAVTNRCGVIGGPGQFGKVDQGVFTLWVLHHYFQMPLRYTGFGGTGKQVRDLLHIDDLVGLVIEQLSRGTRGGYDLYNVGGGLTSSTSLRELTGICQDLTGNWVPIAEETTTTSVDIPLYLSDASKIQSEYGWSPQKQVRDIVLDILAWLKADGERVRESLELGCP
jgi:CDP-paratose 2-epimerase